MSRDKDVEKFNRVVYDWIKRNGLRVGETKAFVWEGIVIIVEKKWEDGAEWRYYSGDSVITF